VPKVKKEWSYTSTKLRRFTMGCNASPPPPPAYLDKDNQSPNDVSNARSGNVPEYGVIDWRVFNSTHARIIIGDSLHSNEIKIAVTNVHKQLMISKDN
jgi:hypothetical protein